LKIDKRNNFTNIYIRYTAISKYGRLAAIYRRRRHVELNSNALTQRCKLCNTLRLRLTYAHSHLGYKLTNFLQICSLQKHASWLITFSSYQSQTSQSNPLFAKFKILNINYMYSVYIVYRLPHTYKYQSKVYYIPNENFHSTGQSFLYTSQVAMKCVAHQDFVYLFIIYKY